MNPFRRRRAREQTMEPNDKRQQDESPQDRLIKAVGRRQSEILRRIQLVEAEVDVLTSRHRTEG